MYFEKAGHYSGKEEKKLRELCGMTQADMAAYLNVSPKTVEAWECGTRNPSGAVCRLLDLLKKTDSVPFSQKQHYLHGHTFQVPVHLCGTQEPDAVHEPREKMACINAMWFDCNGVLQVRFSYHGDLVRIPFPQGLPDRSELIDLHESVGRLLVKDYLRKLVLKKRMREYAAELTGPSSRDCTHDEAGFPFCACIP